MRKVLILILLFFFCFQFKVFSETRGEFSVPRISAKTVKLLILKGVNYIFIDSSTFGDSHICGAVFISYTWIPPYGKNRIKRVNIPKDYYIFCYCT